MTLTADGWNEGIIYGAERRQHGRQADLRRSWKVHLQSLSQHVFCLGLHSLIVDLWLATLIDSRVAPPTPKPHTLSKGLGKPLNIQSKPHASFYWRSICALHISALNQRSLNLFCLCFMFLCLALPVLLALTTFRFPPLQI